MYAKFLLISIMLFWQSQESAPLLLRSEKIYAVMAVVLVIFVSLLVFMFSTQRKVQQLEKLIEEKNKSL